MKLLFPGFAQKALTFSYDDGCIQDRRLTELFREYGVKATFNLCSGWFGNSKDFDHGGFFVHFEQVRADEVRAVYDGFEVASHCRTHRSMKSDKEIVDAELSADVKTLSELVGYPIRGFAYPGGGYDQQSPGRLAAHGLVYGRTVMQTCNFSLPQYFHYWSPTCHDRDDILGDLAASFTAEKDPPELRLLYIWGHSFELEKNDIDRWAKLEGHLRLLSGRDDIWYASNIEIYDYLTAARSCRPTEEGFRNTSGATLYFCRRGERIALAPGDLIRG